MAYKSIRDYGIIGDHHTAALVSNDGSIDWCCLPRFDSSSVFAALLDDDKGGRFYIKPQIPFSSHQAYIPNTNILQLTFQTETGTATVTDFMPCYRTVRRTPGCFHEIHRLVECTQGEMSLETWFEPRLNYARGKTLLNTSKYGVMVKQGIETIGLSSPVPFTIEGAGAIAHLTLRQGQKSAFVLRYGAERPLPSGMYRPSYKLERTKDYWQKQAEECIFTGQWHEAIVRSYLALHLLVYLPTGAIIAAATTSLPEQIGGQRNWDYRYTWLRDSSLTVDALAHLGHKEEAAGFMKWLLSVCDRCGPKAQILYDIDYHDPISEQELDHLKGYCDSRPVRIGNDAYQQLQLDVFGEILEAAYTYINIGGHITRRTWRLLDSLVNAACKIWQQPDNGIWEMRSGPYHFVHSRLMCWVALDKGIKIAEKLGYRKNLVRWRKTAQEIKKIY